MKGLLPLMAAGSAALLLSAAAAPAVLAQDLGYNARPQGGWTLKEREHWISDRLDKAKDDGSIGDREFHRVHRQLERIKHEEDRMRDHQDGELTVGQTQDLEARLDGVADHIQWLHANAFQRPW